MVLLDLGFGRRRSTIEGSDNECEAIETETDLRMDRIRRELVPRARPRRRGREVDGTKGDFQWAGERPFISRLLEPVTHPFAQYCHRSK
jgi:hypothetical protein